jgi:hypothetical protein
VLTALVCLALVRFVPQTGGSACSVPLSRWPARAHPSPTLYSSTTCRNLTIFAVIAAHHLLREQQRATPLYRIYQEHLGLTPLTLTSSSAPMPSAFSPRC